MTSIAPEPSPAPMPGSTPQSGQQPGAAPTGPSRNTELFLRFARVLAWFALAYLVVVEVILAMAFILLLLGADPVSGFVEWVYRSTQRSMAPFRGMFEPLVLTNPDGDMPSILDTSMLFAMLVYGIVLLALKALVDWLSSKLQRIEHHRDALELARAQATYGVPPR